MTTRQSLQAAILCVLSITTLAACDSAPPGVVDDRNKVSTIEFEIAGDSVPGAALVSSDEATMTYRVWALMQPYLAAGKSAGPSFKGFSVVSAHDGLVLLVPPRDWGTDGWFMTCDGLTYKEPHGICSVDGRVDGTVVSVGGWTTDIDRFRPIVDGVRNALSQGKPTQ